MFIKVCEDESESPIEVPLEADGTLSLTTLTAQFPKCAGLKYKAAESGCFRGLRLVDDCIYPPNDCGWSDQLFYCVFPKDNKRKGDEDSTDGNLKMKRLEGRRCTDLIVLNLAWHTDELSLRSYFSRYGDVVMTQIKRDPSTQKSRGYGFVRFDDYSAQVMCLAERHMIDHRLCDVRIPMSKMEGDRQEVSRKIHVGHITEEMTADDLRKVFSDYGRVMDVFIPKPFRSFAFVSFDVPEAAAYVMGKDIEILGKKVTIGSAVPKIPSINRQNQGGDAMNPNAMTSPMSEHPGWGAWSPMFGMYQKSPGYGGAPHGNMRNGNANSNNSGNSPLGLNPAAAVAAAALAAQYTRAHQKQNAGNHPNDYKSNGMQMDSSNNNNNAAMATLNILNNPNVVAAIVSAAAGAASNHQPGPGYSRSGPR